MQLFLLKRNGISLWIALSFLFCAGFLQAQTVPAVTLIMATMQKIDGANTAEFEKIMTENWKPVHQLRKQNGKITNWALYRVRFAGATDEYNYVSVSYYDSFVKTEPNDNFPELMKAANPKADAAAILAKTQGLRTIMRQAIYSRVDGTNANAASKPLKYIVANFM